MQNTFFLINGLSDTMEGVADLTCLRQYLALHLPDDSVDIK